MKCWSGLKGFLKINKFIKKKITSQLPNHKNLKDLKKMIFLCTLVNISKLLSFVGAFRAPSGRQEQDGVTTRTVAPAATW